MRSNISSYPHFGIAGNFANHLEDAGEIEDFKSLSSAPKDAPKGIFPIYIPNTKSFLGSFCIDDKKIEMPNEGFEIQMEPEVYLECLLTYSEDALSEVNPLAAGVYNDCTIRSNRFSKISQKKNWGLCSKGMSTEQIKIDYFGPGGILDRYRLASYVERDGIIHEYGIDSPLVGYQYFYTQLTDWLLERFNEQRDEGPLERLWPFLEEAGRPNRIFITIGSTAYTSFAKNGNLRPGDRLFVVLYDAQNADSTTEPCDGKIVLEQVVI